MQYRPVLVLGAVTSCLAIASCASTTLPRDGPPALRHGQIFDAAVPHPYVGGRAIAECLCQTLKANVQPRCCTTVHVTDRAGLVLAVANVCGAPIPGVHEWQLTDARELLESLLGAIENWDAPFIEITADEVGTIVLASAAFSLPAESPPAPYPMARVIKMFGEQRPVYLKVVADGARRTERLLEKGIMLYYNAQRNAASTPVLSGR